MNGHRDIPVVPGWAYPAGLGIPTQLPREQSTALIATAADLPVVAQPVHSDDTLQAALERLVVSPGGLPIIAPDDGQVVGWLTERDVLRDYARSITASQTDALQDAQSPAQATTSHPRTPTAGPNRSDDAPPGG